MHCLFICTHLPLSLAPLRMIIRIDIIQITFTTRNRLHIQLTSCVLFRDDPTVDIYRQMSSIILNKSADAVTDGERSQFKIITLAILYGMSANQVATQLKISKNNAQQLMADFFRRFRRVKPWMDDLKAYA